MTPFKDHYKLWKSFSQARRMIGRWAGIRGPGRKNWNPNENVMTREEHLVQVYSATFFCFFCNYWFYQDDENNDVVCEPPKTIAVHDRCQVLVVGGGPSGVFVSYLTWQPYLLCKNIRFHKKSNKTSQNAKFHQVYLLPWLPGELAQRSFSWRGGCCLFRRLKKTILWRFTTKIWLLWWLYHHRWHGDPGLVQVSHILTARHKCGEKTSN